MSALSYISEYGSNSEDSDGDDDSKNHNQHRHKLPPPDLSKVAVVPLDVHEDDPRLHNGRLRTFAHVRGNWATFVYISYPEVDVICELIDKLEETVLTQVESCHRCDDFHISLSKTFVLKYHMISSFRLSLQKGLNSSESFDLGFAGVNIYCNEENSRTFISLEVDPFTQKYLLATSQKVDEVLKEYQLPTFYENPSFHMSILWVNGNKKSELNKVLNTLNDILLLQIEKSLKSVLISTINCKSGNKYFQFSLG